MFDNLRTHAKSRGIAFSLTLVEFRQFAELSGYADRHGRERDGLTVDRIECREGYHAWNIQALPNAENVRKQHAELRHALGPKHTRAIILAGWREHRQEERRAA